jgi:hypothetical protein
MRKCAQACRQCAATCADVAQAGQFGGLLHKMKVWATGGGAGIARATASLFAEGGARVVITGRRSEPLDFGFMTLFDYVEGSC